MAAPRRSCQPSIQRPRRLSALPPTAESRERDVSPVIPVVGPHVEVALRLGLVVLRLGPMIDINAIDWHPGTRLLIEIGRQERLEGRRWVGLISETNETVVDLDPVVVERA